MQNSISIVGGRLELAGAYATSFTVYIPALLWANRLYIFSTGDANEFAVNWYLVWNPKRSLRPAQAVMYRPIHVFRPRKTLAVSSSNKSDLAICFPFTNNTRRFTVCLCECNSATRSPYERMGRPLRFAIFLINPGLDLWNAKLKRNPVIELGREPMLRFQIWTDEYL